MEHDCTMEDGKIIGGQVGKALFVNKVDVIEYKSIDEMVAETRRKVRSNAIKGNQIQNENRNQCITYKFQKKENLLAQSIKREEKLVETSQRVRNQAVEKHKKNVAYTKKWEEFRIQRELVIQNYVSAK